MMLVWKVLLVLGWGLALLFFRLFLSVYLKLKREREMRKNFVRLFLALRGLYSEGKGEGE